jgi:hypothetical protein
MVDQSFADQLMKDSCFRDELKLMKHDEKSYEGNVSRRGTSQSYVFSAALFMCSTYLDQMVMSIS